MLWDQPGDRHIREEAWNTYEILAVDNYIKTAINGNKCVDFNDSDGALKGIIRKSKTDQYGRGRLVFGSERSAKLVRKWLRLKPEKIQPVFCAINHGRCEDRAICDRNVNDIIKRGVVKVKRC